MATNQSEPSKRGLVLRRRLPLVVALLAGAFVWKGGFGFFATSRAVTFRLAVPYADVRKLELEVWREDVLLRRVEQVFPSGISSELTSDVVMRKGVHRGIAKVWLKGVVEPRVFVKPFDPLAQESLALDLGP